MKTRVRAVGEKFVFAVSDRPRRRDRPKAGHAHLLRRLAGLLDCAIDCAKHYREDFDQDQQPLYWAQRFALVAVREPLDELRKVLVGAWGGAEAAIDAFLAVVKQMCDFVLQMHFVPPKPHESWKVTREIVTILAPLGGPDGDFVRYIVNHTTHRRDPIAFLYYAAHRYVK